MSAAHEHRPHEGFVRVPARNPGNVRRAPKPTDVTITAERLDAVSGLLDADFVKIDVEGAEWAVWHGMEGLLQNGRSLTVVLEYQRGRYKDAEAFVDQLSRHGFAMSVIDPHDGFVPIDRAFLLDAPSAEDQLVVLRR